MNEELQKALAEILNSAIDAKDFLLSEMPDVINQLLWWHGVKSGLLCLFGAVILLMVYNISMRIHNKIKNKYWDETVYLAVAFIGGLVSVIATFELINLDWLQILIAPKLYLIEYAAKLVG